ncbi:flagellar basal body rod protein FlgB [Priestia flexa]|jgi:flagellar basal-body rod protein FlgB|uniref:Flagellar basal body rod protein FlgB n=2 Tax=Priestia TaxID=2800373 RepID=A0A0V8JRM8_9BACI|nr:MULTISPECIES: flagellar basal body rod protein FlgB [Bacillaceae]AQX54042.1 flagellar basal body rod protein FlgB [Priestia flexa]KSU89669.1 flagellar biosynthesis protein FlgB [Priestia veravalensis]KZB93276.1 flagellar biosynthesis protein FlgB [Bacillus sp. VT 712]MBN8250091.1 flagellar basal body rod protein FlgB [Priestia flexa]MBN8434586.1 flagellar basal body rod protein FlgB [Priestia flexa]
MSLFSGTIQSLEQGLNYSTLKQQTISQNIANVDTPNYKAKDVSRKNQFQSELQYSLKAYRTNEKHIEFSKSSEQAAVISRTSHTYQENGNGVDLDKEMTTMAENQIYYEALIDRLNGKFNSLQTVIRGGK